MYKTVKVSPGIDLDRNMIPELCSVVLNKLVTGVIHAFYFRECVKSIIMCGESHPNQRQISQREQVCV
jgi:hypothetical protein